MNVSKEVCLAYFEHESKLAVKIAQLLKLSVHPIEAHTFPDQEHLIKIHWDVKARDVILITSLAKPDNKMLSLIFAADTLRSKGANSITLLTPYLPYMRQDKQFHPDEGITSQYFAKLISTYFDGLITLDPHLHRYETLSEIYTIPSFVAHASKAIADWIKIKVPEGQIIGPDSESEQWVKSVAQNLRFPYSALNKTRHGDTSVDINIGDLTTSKSLTPILIDDIISSGHTLLKTCQILDRSNFAQPIIIGIHGIFADSAYEDLLEYTEHIYTTNSITHVSNKIDISTTMAEAITNFLSNNY